MQIVGLALAGLLILGFGYFLIGKRREDKAAGETRDPVSDAIAAEHDDV
jgi:LPXTG-motif cell wall-anchored protein